ncbi:NAD dependent epimerase/dehydratase [Aspergillus ambiguus]|uniref:NAD dependent epimerase/dehydratase n=1 Tax=Aspergillus ambiguus TaxID=176160 RepID=UPI003CCD05DD
MDNTKFALGPGSRILVTGANGYIASHVVDQLLALGFLVRGTIRTPKPWLDAYFEDRYKKGMFESAIVPSFEDIHAINRILDGVDGVVHLASDLTFGTDPEAVIPWVIQATLNILEAAAKRPSIKRMVLVSSSSATYMLDPRPNGRTIHADTWNEEAVRLAWDENMPPEKKGVAVYAASKTEGERQSWKWVKENNPPFAFNTVLPSFNVGRILHPEIFGSTMGWTRKLLEGNPAAFSKFPEQWFVDVEDVARLCVISLLDVNVKSERIFGFAEQVNWTDVVRMLRQLRPTNKDIPDPPKNEKRDKTHVIPRDRAEKLLQTFYGQPAWTPIQDSLEKGIDGMS